MSRLPRIVAWLLLAVLGLSVGDWPYVDEILADLTQEQPEGRVVAKETSPSPGARAPHGSKIPRLHVFEILVGIQPVPSHDRFVVAARRDRFVEFPDPVFFVPSPLPDLLNRPPILGSRA